MQRKNNIENLSKPFSNTTNTPKEMEQRTFKNHNNFSNRIARNHYYNRVNKNTKKVISNQPKSDQFQQEVQFQDAESYKKYIDDVYKRNPSILAFRQAQQRRRELMQNNNVIPIIAHDNTPKITKLETPVQRFETKPKTTPIPENRKKIVLGRVAKILKHGVIKKLHKGVKITQKGIKVTKNIVKNNKKQLKKKKGIKITPINRNKRITLLSANEAFINKDSHLRFALYSWKYKELRLTISPSTQITEPLFVLLANHLLHEISQIVIGDMLPFNPLSESLTTQIFVR